MDVCLTTGRRHIASESVHFFLSETSGVRESIMWSGCMNVALAALLALKFSTQVLTLVAILRTEVTLHLPLYINQGFMQLVDIGLAVVMGRRS
eukprot:6491186-Amphidinium_carterae.1